MMEKIDLTIPGSRHRPIALDVSFDSVIGNKPVIIFSHGFKGFKDWGHFNLIARHFAESGFVFVKFNFSYNGTTLENPIDFVDLDAFSNNTFGIEVDDLGLVIDWVLSEKGIWKTGLGTEPKKIFLLGHSRGGSISIIKAAEDTRVQKLVTWAAVSDFEQRWTKEVRDYWKANEIIYTKNARTGQEMPLKYELLSDYYNHVDRLNIRTAAGKINIPFLIIHGTKDESVPLSEGEAIHKWAKGSEFLGVQNAQHTFGGAHPYQDSDLPPHTQEIISKTINFYKQ